MHAAVFVLNTVWPDFLCTLHTSHPCIFIMRLRLFFVTPSAPPYNTIAHHSMIKLHYIEHTEKVRKSLEMTKRTGEYNLPHSRHVDGAQSQGWTKCGRLLTKKLHQRTVPIKSPTAADKKTWKKLSWGWPPAYTCQLRCTSDSSTVEKISDFQL